MKDIKAVFDIGNDCVKGIVFANDNGKDVVLVKQIEQTQGMRKGKILDTEAFAQLISSMVDHFVKKLGGDFIDETYVGISHPETKIMRITEQKRVMKGVIEADDIDHLSKVVIDIANQSNYETIKIVPVYRMIDETKREKDPIGLQGKKLELVADVFMVPKSFYNTLIEIFDRVGLQVTDVVPNIISSAEIALDYDHRDLGTLLVDIGKNQTSYVIYEEGYPLGYGTIPLGGEDVTKDISIGLQVDIKEAEQIKRNYGTVVIDPELDQESPLDIQFLSDIITARYEEIFNKIIKHLNDTGKDGRLPGGVLLLGGGSKMQNLNILCKDTFRLATFYAKDQQLHMGELSANLQFLNVLGSYVRGNKYSEGRRGSLKINFEFVGKIGKFFKDLF